MPKRRAKGEGTIYQRKDGSWAGQITLPNGKRATKYGKSQAVVRDWLTAQRGAISVGSWSSDTSARLGDFLTAYLTDVVTNQVRPGTLASYTQVATSHIIPKLGKMRLTNLRPEHLQRLYTELIDAGLAPGTVLIVHGVLHQTLQQAAEWGVVPRNVASLVHPPRRKAPPPEILTMEQLGLLLAETKKSTRLRWMYALIYLAAATGLRRGELLGLHWSDIDLEQKTLRVSRIVNIDRDGNIVEAEPKTASSRRLITLPDDAVAVLREYKAHSAHDILFSTKRGTYKLPMGLTSSWRDLLKTRGLPHVKFHSLRHLHATLLLEQHINPKVVSERLGHSNIAITLETYSHVTTELEHEAASAIGEAMRGLRTQ